MPVCTEVEVPDQTFHDIFVTALEGGIDYWCDVDSYHWALPIKDRGPLPATTERFVASPDDLQGFHARVLAEDAPGVEENGGLFTIDRDTLIRGVTLMLAGPVKGLQELGRQRIVKELVSGEPDLDADYADVIVQTGLFGEVIYS